MWQFYKLHNSPTVHKETILAHFRHLAFKKDWKPYKHKHCSPKDLNRFYSLSHSAYALIQLSEKKLEDYSLEMSL